MDDHEAEPNPIAEESRRLRASRLAESGQAPSWTIPVAPTIAPVGEAPPEVAPDARKVVRGIAGSYIGDLAVGLAGIGLLLMAILVSIPIFVGTFLVFSVIGNVTHAQGTPAAVLGMIWFVGTLVLLGVVLQRVLRRFR